jgi:hypothetical protein
MNVTCTFQKHTFSYKYIIHFEIHNTTNTEYLLKVNVIRHNFHTTPLEVP